MRKYIILLILLAGLAFAQADVDWWVFDGGGGMRAPGAGDTVWASIGQAAIGCGCGVTYCNCAGYLCLFPGACVKIDEDDRDEDGDGKIDRPYTFGIDVVRPNPFNSACEIEFEIEQPTKVSFEIYDLLGNLVDRPVDDVQMTEGRYRLTWQATGNPTGTYFARLSTPQKHEVTKLLYLK